LPPPELYKDWSKTVTLKLNLGVIKYYNRYINWLLKKAIKINITLNFVLAYIIEKKDKAKNALNLLAIIKIDY